MIIGILMLAAITILGICTVSEFLRQPSVEDLVLTLSFVAALLALAIGVIHTLI